MKLEEVLFEVTSNNLTQIRIKGKIKLWNLRAPLNEIRKKHRKLSIVCQAPNKIDSSKKHISTQRYVCLYSIGVMPFSLSCGLSKLYHAMKLSICCINSVSFSGTNNSKDSLLR